MNEGIKCRCRWRNCKWKPRLDSVYNKIMASSEEHNNVKDEMMAETSSTSDDNMLMMPDFLAESLTDSFNPAAVPSETTTATDAAAQPVQPDLSIKNDNINSDNNVDGAALF